MHFGRAAKALYTAQPALSLSIQRFEQELGFPLFERSRRYVLLTPAGAGLLPEARRTLAQAEHTAHVAERLRRGAHGQLRIGFVGSATYGALPSVVSAFRRAAPEVSLSLKEMSTHAQVDALHNDELDVGFIRPPAATGELQLATVRRDPLLVAMPSTHPLCGVDCLALKELVDEPFVLFPRAVGPGYVDMVVSACRSAGFSPRVEHEVDDMQTHIGLVAAGLGVALVPEPVSWLQMPGVVYKSLIDPTSSELAVAWPCRTGAPMLERFVSLVREMTDDDQVLAPPVACGLAPLNNEGS